MSLHSPIAERNFIVIEIMKSILIFTAAVFASSTGFSSPLLEEPFIIDRTEDGYAVRTASPVDVSVGETEEAKIGKGVYLNTVRKQRLLRTGKDTSYTSYFRLSNDADTEEFKRMTRSNVVVWDLYRVKGSSGNSRLRALYIDREEGNITAQITRGYRMNITTDADRLIRHRVSMEEGLRKRKAHKVFQVRARSTYPGPDKGLDAASVKIAKKKDRGRR